MDIPVLKQLASKVKADYSQKEFKRLWRHQYDDRYKEYVSQTRGLAIIYDSPNKEYKFHYNENGAELLHVGKERIFHNYFGLMLRKNNLYNEVVLE